MVITIILEVRPILFSHSCDVREPHRNRETHFLWRHGSFEKKWSFTVSLLQSAPLLSSWYVFCEWFQCHHLNTGWPSLCIVYCFLFCFSFPTTKSAVGSNVGVLIRLLPVEAEDEEGKSYLRDSASTPVGFNRRPAIFTALLWLLMHPVNHQN